MEQWEQNIYKVDKLLYDYLKGKPDGLTPPQCIEIIKEVYDSYKNKALAFRNDLRELEKQNQKQEIFYTEHLKIEHIGGKYARWHIYRII